MKKITTHLLLIVGVVCFNFSTIIYSQSIFPLEDFESSGPDIPTTWTEDGLSTDGVWSVGSNTDASSTYWNVTSHTTMAYTNDDACNCDKSEDRLILPLQDFSALSVAPSLFLDVHNNGNYGGTSYIEVSLDGGSTWQIEHTISESPSWQDGLEYVISHAGESSVTIAIRYDDGGFWASGLAVDNVSILPAATCPNPTSIALVNQTANSADISWTAGGSETSWQVQYDTAGFVPGTGNFATTSSASYSMTALSSLTSYNVYVRAICAVGDTSTWEGPFNITTSGDCSSSGSYTYGNNEDASNATNFTANTPGDWITLTFTVGVAELNWDFWYVTDSLNGQGNVIESGTGNIMNSSNSGIFESSTGLISFYVDSDGSVTGQTFVFSASCSAPPACSAPSAFTATNVTTSSADLGWTAGTTASSFDLEYGPTGFALGSGTTVSGAANPYAISGLTQGTTYDIYVQSICSTGDSSSMAGPFTFSTPCGVNTAPWHESFSSAMPNCWSESGIMTALYSTVQTGDNWNFTNYNAYAGYYMHIGGNYQDLTPFPFGYCAFVNGNEGAGTYGPATLTTPTVSVVPLTNPEVSFLLNSNRESDSVNAILDVEASNDSGSTWSSVASLQGNTNGWIRQHVDLSAYSGDTIQVRFIYSEPDTAGGVGAIAQLDHIAIDEITIGEAATCFEISNLSLSNVTGNSVDLNWVAGGSEASWDILASSSSGNVGAQSTDTAFTLTGLSGATSYDLYVRAICGVGDSSAWYGPVSLFTYPDGPNGVTCGLGDTNATVFTNYCEDWTGWTGDTATTGNGVWRINSGPTGSGGTGPSGAHEGFSYFYFESSTAASQNDTATIYTPLIDLSDAVGGSAELSFWMHAYGNNMGNLHIGASSTLTGTYDSLATFSGQIQGSEALAYANLGVDLSAYVGDTVFLSFTYTRNPLGGFTQDLAIDLIEVNTCIVPPPHDMAIVAAAVASGCDLTATEPIEVWVVNNGLVAESSFDLSYAVNGGTPVVESITSTLNVGDTLMHVFAATADMSADGVYNLDFGLVVALDNDTSDNSMMFTAENYLNPAAPTTVGDSICNGDTATVNATGVDYIYWYDAASGGNLVGGGDELHVSPSATTSYFAEAAYMEYFMDDFEGYNSGDWIALSNPSGPWVTWPNGIPGDLYDAPVTNAQASTGSNSLHLDNAASNTPDPVLLFNQTWDEGSFEFTMDMYVATSGYFNLQGDVTPATVWAMEMTFDNSGNFDLGSGALTGSYPGTGVWFNISLQCTDLSTGVWELLIDGNSQGTVTLLSGRSVGGANFYAAAGNDYYIDNVMWSSPIGGLACKSGTRTEAVVTVNDCSNINELSFKDLGIYPNPNNGQFTIINSQEITEIVITDLQGKIVYNNNNINLNKVNVELVDLERGMYMINIKTLDGMITKTVTLQ